MINVQCLAFTTSCSGLADRLINEAYIISGEEKMHTNYAQWDTGASRTCISRAVADRLGLIPIGQAMVKTPSGEKMTNVYVVDILLRNNVMVKDVTVIGSEIGAQNIDLLIGMDIINIGDFAVTNVGGRTTFTFRTPSVKTIDFCKEFTKMDDKSQEESI